MNPRLHVPRIPATALILATALLAAGCKPHETHGTVDEANAITLEDIAKLGVEGARAKYAGKIVTFKGPMVPVGVSSKNEGRKNVCMQSFLHRFSDHRSINGFKNAAVRVYFNYGDEIDGWFEHFEHRPDDLRLENPLTLDFDVCDTAGICNEGDSEKKCLFSSDQLLLTGKVAAIYQEGDYKEDLRIAIRPVGVRY